MIPLSLHRRTLILNRMRSGKADAVLAMLSVMQPLQQDAGHDCAGSRQSTSDACDPEDRPIDFLSAEGTGGGGGGGRRLCH